MLGLKLNHVSKRESCSHWQGSCSDIANESTCSGRFNLIIMPCQRKFHADFIKWKHFPHYWPFVLGIKRSPANSPHKGRWRGSLMFSLIGARTNGWVNNWDVVDLGSHRAQYDVTVMFAGRNCHVYIVSWNTGTQRSLFLAGWINQRHYSFDIAPSSCIK